MRHLSVCLNLYLSDESTKKCNLKLCFTKRKPYINALHKQRQVLWAPVWRTQTQQKYVLWSEKIFLLCGKDENKVQYRLAHTLDGCNILLDTTTVRTQDPNEPTVIRTQPSLTLYYQTGTVPRQSLLQFPDGCLVFVSKQNHCSCYFSHNYLSDVWMKYAKEIQT